ARPGAARISGRRRRRAAATPRISALVAGGLVTCIMQVTRPIFPPMRRKSFQKMHCPIARSLERVGEWWSILILRDALHGFRRFDEFQNSLGIAPNTLTRRLNDLVEAGLLERRRYNEHPPRYEYLPTTRTRDFAPVLIALLAWGNKHFAPEGASVLLVDATTGETADPILVDRISGRPIAQPEYKFAPG